MSAKKLNSPTATKIIKKPVVQTQVDKLPSPFSFDHCVALFCNNPVYSFQLRITEPTNPKNHNYPVIILDGFFMKFRHENRAIYKNLVIGNGFWEAGYMEILSDQVEYNMTPKEWKQVLKSWNTTTSIGDGPSPKPSNNH